MIGVMRRWWTSKTRDQRVMVIPILLWVAVGIVASSIVLVRSRPDVEPWARRTFEQRVRSVVDDTVLRCWWLEGDDRPFFCEVETR